MNRGLSALLAASCGPMLAHSPRQEEISRLVAPWGSQGEELQELLMAANGASMYESALLVRPFSSSRALLGLLEWNCASLWKQEYSPAFELDRILCFAEDIFGCQYCLTAGGVGLMEPETGLVEVVAGTLEQWAALVLEDPGLRTGYPLGQSWQARNGPLRTGTRLLPKVPFVLGGAYDVANLYALDDVAGMIYRGSLASQLRDIPDGGAAMLRAIDPDSKSSP